MAKMEGLDRHAIFASISEYIWRVCTIMYVPIYSDDGEFKGYHIAEGAPKTIKRHFEMLTKWRRNRSSNKLYRIWRYVHHRGCTWLWTGIVASAWQAIASVYRAYDL